MLGAGVVLVVVGTFRRSWSLALSWACHAKARLVIKNIVASTAVVRVKKFAKDIDFTKTSLPKLLIAYEPVWAIGTGLTPTPSEVDSVHNFISEILSTLQIPAPILYGGSVNDKNAQEFASLPMVNGVLVGGASLKADSFMTIIGAFANK